MLTFYHAFRELIYGGGTTAMQRKGWNSKGMEVKIQYPDANSKMQQPYLYIEKEGENRVPWVPSQGDLFATDWRLL